MAQIFGYHSDVPDLVRFDELKLVNLWRQRWEAAGWTPIVLNEYIARQHPYFDEYDRAVSALPCVNPKAYEVACWHRWLALAQVGGGYMADSDCIPHSALTLPLPAHLQMFDSHAPSFVFASKTGAERLCHEFATGKFGKRDIDGREHYSDMYALEDLRNGEDKWIEVHAMVSGYGDPGWETATVVHYSKASMAAADKLPKWRHIPKLR